MATAFTGPRLGGAFLFVNLVVLLAYVGAYQLVENFRGEMTASFSSAVFSAAHFVTLFFLLCLLVPIKVSGYIEGPRTGKVFDQFVVTGMSPLRVHAGTWYVGMLYSATLLFITLPFAGCAVFFLDVERSDMLIGYGVLVLHSNWIIGLTLANSMLEREWRSVPLTILIVGLFAFLSLIFEPDFMQVFTVHIAELTPLRLLLRCIVWDHTDVPAMIQAHIGVDPYFFRVAIPLNVYPFILWGLVVGICLLIVTLGSSHHFTNGFNAFGTVVLKGDRKKRFSRRLRGALTRKVELAFFYENRPRWCDRWEFPLRSF